VIPAGAVGFHVAVMPVAGPGRIAVTWLI